MTTWGKQLKLSSGPTELSMHPSSATTPPGPHRILPRKVNFSFFPNSWCLVSADSFQLWRESYHSDHLTLILLDVAIYLPDNILLHSACDSVTQHAYDTDILYQCPFSFCPPASSRSMHLSRTHLSHTLCLVLNVKNKEDVSLC